MYTRLIISETFPSRTETCAAQLASYVLVKTPHRSCHISRHVLTEHGVKVLALSSPESPTNTKACLLSQPTRPIPAILVLGKRVPLDKAHVSFPTHHDSGLLHHMGNSCPTLPCCCIGAQCDLQKHRFTGWTLIVRLSMGNVASDVGRRQPGTARQRLGTAIDWRPASAS